MSANILQSYLVKLGVELDVDSLTHFFDSAAKGLASVADLGNAAVGSFGSVQDSVNDLAGTKGELKEVGEQVNQTAKNMEKFDDAATKSEKSAKKFTISLSGLSRVAGEAVKSMAKLGTAAFGAFGAIQAGVLKLASEEANLKDVSDRVGVTVEGLEQLGYVASQSGSSAEALHASLEGLKRKAGEAAMGMAGAVRVFDDIKVSATDANGDIKDTATLLDDLGRAMAGKDSGEQLSILQRLGMDKTLIRTLTEDTRELEDEFAAMAKIASVDFNKTSDAAAELMDEFGKATTFSKLLTKSLGGGLMESFRDGLKKGRKWVVENIELVQGVIKGAVKVVESAATVASRFLMRIGQALIWLHEKTDGFSTAMMALAGVIMWLGGPVTAAVALLTGLFLIIDDLMTALEGGETFFDWSPWLEDIRAAKKWLEDLGGAIKAEFLTALKDVVDWLDRIAKSLGFGSLDTAINAVIKSIPGIVGELAKLVAYMGGGAWAVVKGAFGAVGDAIEAVIGILQKLGNFLINVLTGNFSAAFKDIKGAVGIFDDFMQKTFGRVKELVLGVVGAIGDAIDKLKEYLGLGTPKAPDEPEAPTARMEAVPTHIAPASSEDQPFAEEMPEETARRVAALPTRPNSEKYAPPISRTNADSGRPPKIAAPTQPSWNDMMTGFRTPPPKTGIDPSMLKAPPLGIEKATPYYQRKPEQTQVTVHQENSISITAPSPAEAGRRVETALGQTERKMDGVYRNMVGKHQ